jgi:hypothetical protein
VTRTWDSPQPGSDEINRAHSDAWVGTQGYLRSDGSRQKRAVAFIGNVIALDGTEVPELFVVDIPDDVTDADTRPLCGTPSTRPAPPKGTRQRRLTRTTDRKHPGLGAVRHWPRSSPDGSKIAFLMPDNEGQTQLWTISTTGNGLRQLTGSEMAVESAFTWRPDSRAIACVIGGRICEIDSETGTSTPRTARSDGDEGPRPEAVVYSPDGACIAFMRQVKSIDGTFNQVFVARSELGQ